MTAIKIRVGEKIAVLPRLNPRQSATKPLNITSSNQCAAFTWRIRSRWPRTLTHFQSGVMPSLIQTHSKFSFARVKFTKIFLIVPKQVCKRSARAIRSSLNKFRQRWPPSSSHKPDAKNNFLEIFEYDDFPPANPFQSRFLPAGIASYPEQCRLACIFRNRFYHVHWMRIVRIGQLALRVTAFGFKSRAEN